MGSLFDDEYYEGGKQEQFECNRYQKLDGSGYMRKYFSVVHDSENGEIYVTGGMAVKTSMRMKECQKYVLSTDKWVKLPDMSQTRIGHACFLNGGYLYSFGGR